LTAIVLSKEGTMSKRALKLFGLGTALVLVLAAVGLISGAESLAAQSCTVTVSPGESVQQAIESAPSGAVICLGEGTWEENLVIVGKSLTIRGAGAGKTVIWSAEENRPVVWIEGDEIEVHVEGLTITGAFGGCSDWPERCAHGLVVKGSAQVSLTDSQVSDNEVSGLYVGDSARVSLEGSTVSGNDWFGLLVDDSARVEVRKSRFLYNAGAGIWVASEEVQVEGTPNEMRGNGVDLLGYALPSLRKPLVSQTDRTQLSVPRDYATVQEAVDAVAPGGTITIAEGTYIGGITLWKPVTLRGAGQEATILQAQEDRKLVISIPAGVQEARLEKLAVRGSERDGLLIYGQAHLEELQVSSNGDDGLEVWGSAQVALKDSIVSGNRWNGLVAVGSAQVSLQGCTVSDNGNGGLWVGDSAQVSLEDSTVSDNRLDGLVVGGSARVSLQGSTVSGNRWIGLEVGDSARVEVRESRFLDNAGAGILVASEKAQVEGTPNEMRGNGVDLAGYAPPSLRKPLVPQTDRTQLFIPGDYATVQEAVDAVAPSGTITIGEGTYIGGITIWKPVTLKGAGREATILQAQEGGSLVIFIPAGVHGVRLEKLAVRGSRKNGILIYGQAHLEELQVYDNEWNGLEVGDSGQVSLQDSTVFDNGWSGLDVRDSAQVSLEGSTVVSDNIGLEVWGSAQVTLKDSTISGNVLDGLWVSGSARVTLQDSTVSNNGDNGLEVKGSARVTLQDSTVSDNEEDGLLVKDEAHVELTNTTIRNNRGWGIAACLGKCGCDEDDFEGTVLWEGRGNEIYDNGKGDVCLP